MKKQLNDLLEIARRLVAFLSFFVALFDRRKFSRKVGLIRNRMRALALRPRFCPTPPVGLC